MKKADILNAVIEAHGNACRALASMNCKCLGGSADQCLQNSVSKLTSCLVRLSEGVRSELP